LGTEVAGLLAATIARLCAGQVNELQDAFSVARTEDGYFRSIAGKTAALFSTSCRIGAIVGGLERDRIEALTTFGEAYGMAFQIVDDVLDVVATDEALGKPSGHDMVEGTYTLPVLRVLNGAGPGGADLKTRLGGPLSDDDRLVARDLVRADREAVASSIVDARRHADRAIAALGDDATTEAGQWLVATANGLLTKVEAASSTS
jgi:heptaprenyl diphosphate synthase